MQEPERLTHYLKTTIVVKQWLEEVLVVKLQAELLESLKNGVVLCYLMNEIHNKLIIPKIQEQTAQVFKLKENISAFLLACEEYGVHKTRLFRPNDLYERKNEVIVVECLMELGTLAAQRGFRPSIQAPDTYKGPLPDLSSAEKSRLSQQLVQLKDKRKAVKNTQRISPEIFKRRLQFSNQSGTIDWPTLEKRLTLFQALMRTYVQQKQYRRKVRDMAYREHVAKEIYFTENAYLNSLKTCTRCYRTPLEDEAVGNTISTSLSPTNAAQNTAGSLYTSPSNPHFVINASPSSPKVTPLISREDITIIFSNMNVLIGFNSELLADLDDRLKNWTMRQKIGDLFVKMLPHLKIYTQYLSNYNAAHARLVQLKQNSQWNFRLF